MIGYRNPKTFLTAGFPTSNTAPVKFCSTPVTIRAGQAFSLKRSTTAACFMIVISYCAISVSSDPR